MTAQLMHESVSHPSAWMDEAACLRVGLYPDSWFPQPYEHEQGELARAVCRFCPVTAECLREALEDSSLTGIWGGTDELERKRIRRRKPPHA